VVEEEKVAKGTVGFAGQHQQRPVPLAGNIFKRGWFDHTYPLDPMTQRGQIYQIVQSWDTAAKTGQENDYSACTTWGISKNFYYLLDVWTEKVEFPDLKKMVRAMAAKWRPSAILVEDSSAGVAILQELKRETHLPLLAVTVIKDKTARAMTASPTFEAGNVLMPANPPAWYADYVGSMTIFPAGLHEDPVDSTTQFINWANLHGQVGEIRGAGDRVAGLAGR
jgi:predicted phage terminase large subunit-like protein